MIVVLIRFMIVYAVLTASMKLLGKRQIGQMQQSEFITALLISDLACSVVTDEDIPLSYGLLPVIFMICFEVMISYGTVKIPFLKRLFDAPGVFLIRDGVLDQKEMMNNRVTIDELLGLLRLAGAPDIAEVRDAVLEANGEMSVSLSDASPASFAVVEDGVINEKALSRIGRDGAWLKRILSEKGKKEKDLFLVCASSKGICYLCEREKNK
ncbi:MAG: DUF421 domain-containing protein [Clostridia bacterium]|nr:DUF421 domain-containing protein [Clostridia bacterium]